MIQQKVTFESLRPMLRTKDLRGTIRFYTELLGFSCESFSEQDGWASLRRDSVELMVAAPNAHEPFDASRFTGSFYFNVDNVAALWDAVKDRAKVGYPMDDFFYGMREFAIYDNNGYMLQFGWEI
jgi:uncharacterized glyoxalase superfamily protein PhnB